MGTSLALAASLFGLAAGEADAVKFSNVRFVYSVYGMARPAPKLLPGDRLCLAFDIENLAIDKKTGKVVYRLDLEFLDSKGNRVYRTESKPIEEENTLLSFTQPGTANVIIGKDQPPGKYTVKVTATDDITKKSASFERQFEILKEGLGFVRVQAPVVVLVGTPFVMQFTAVGFGKENKVPSFSVEVNILNDKGEAMLAKPKRYQVPKDLAEDIKPEDVNELPFTFTFALNRVGKYTVAVKLTDKTTKKEVELKSPVTVLDVKKYESAK
jgi:hypothetical protein